MTSSLDFIHGPGELFSMSLSTAWDTCADVGVVSRASGSSETRNETN